MLSFIPHCYPISGETTALMHELLALLAFFAAHSSLEGVNAFSSSLSGGMSSFIYLSIGRLMAALQAFAVALAMQWVLAWC